MAPWQSLAEKYGIRSNLTVPLAIQGQTIAALMVYAAHNDAFGDEEIKLIEELAGNVARGIEAIRNRKDAQGERERRAQVEDQLVQAQKLEAIGQLAGGIAHDFNNLLMVIMAHTELLSQQLEGAALERAEKVMKSASRAAELTRQLLAFSRKQATQPIRTSMNQLVNGVSDMLQRLVGEDVEVRLVLRDKPWPVKTDRVQFEQVIMNLAVNARDAMPNGGRLTLETANVEIGEEYSATHFQITPGKYALLAVTDTGTGMSAEVQARAFEPFFTTKGMGKGTGLGLSMVYGIVKQSNGYIGVYSEVGEGTCFKIHLPKADEKEDIQPERNGAPSAAIKKQGTILVVEDADTLREAITDFLKSGGHKVIAVSGVEEACRVAQERRREIDLLLTDVVLKDGNCKQLLQRLGEQGCAFKVVYMSGYTPDAIVRHGVLDPEMMFLQKPFSQSALLEKVEEALSSGS